VGKPRTPIDGFTPEQRFFLGFANGWCENVTEAAERQFAQTDNHSPGRYRVIGTISNMEEFQKAFSCRKGQPMVRENACRAW
jgi:putative endopeptidase